MKQYYIIIHGKFEGSELPCTLQWTFVALWISIKYSNYSTWIYQSVFSSHLLWWCHTKSFKEQKHSTVMLRVLIMQWAFLFQTLSQQYLKKLSKISPSLIHIDSLCEKCPKFQVSFRYGQCPMSLYEYLCKFSRFDYGALQTLENTFLIAFTRNYEAISHPSGEK